ncbi:hypothetical protein FACS1894214_4180 [Planctomycetales bacterium]|nr:hypothetical protein FACS1894214_4180 [Planctomycetales bacterium]
MYSISSPYKQLLPIELMIGNQCKSEHLKNNFLSGRRIRVIRNIENGQCYLYSEYNSTLNPFANGIDRFNGYYNNRLFEFYFERSWYSGVYGGPDKAILRDKDNNIYARTEKFQTEKIITDDLIIHPRLHVFHTSDGDYILQHKEYKNMVNFFECPAFPKRDIELRNKNNDVCMWGGLNKPRELKILRDQKNLHILLSLFYAIYILLLYRPEL